MTNLPWQPEKGTPLAMIACVNFGGDLGLYSQGFQDGAAQLFAAIKDRQPQDLLVYPLVYCLRHSVELSLKQVIRAGRNFADEASDFPDSHSLEHLWDVCGPLLRTIWPTDPSYEQILATVKALAAIDPLGEGFRYPVTTKRKGTRGKTLAPKLRRLDLQKLFDDVNQTLLLLGGADTGISVALDNKAEMKAALKSRVLVSIAQPPDR
jgi:hypothetical protein